MVVTLQGALAVHESAEGAGAPALFWQDVPAGLPADRSDLPEDTIELFLGEEDQPLVALVVPDQDAWELPAGVAWGELRVLGPELGDTDVAAAVTAAGMARWHERHAFSPETGEPTEVTASGWVRRAPDGRQHFPRSAVVREVQEEVGVVVDQVRYVGSQPWPFPASLMVGFTARTGEQPDVVPVEDLEAAEIAEARWLTREQLATELQAGTLGLPGPISIARQLIERWYGGPLPVREEIWGSVRG